MNQGEINTPVTKRTRSTRYGCQRARGLRPSCHPRSRAASFVVYSDLRAAGVRSRAASCVVCGALCAADARSRAANCALLTRAHALHPAWFAATCALLTRAHARRPACVAANCARLARAHARHPARSTAHCALLTRAHALRPACVAPTRALLTRAHAPRIQRRAIDSRPLTRGAFRPTQDAGPKGRVARGAKPSCSLTWRPALSVARGMRNAMGVSVSRRESGRNQYAGDEAHPIDAVRMSESTRASPLVPPALARGVLRGLRRIARC